MEKARTQTGKTGREEAKQAKMEVTKQAQGAPTARPQPKGLATRTGLRLVSRRGEPEVAQAIAKFGKWLRQTRDFPVRVPVYLLAGEVVRTFDGRLVTASFFAPFDRTEEPYIRIATGDYPVLKKQRGRDNAIAAILCSLAHEIIHYEQWVRNGRTSEAGVAKKALALVARYAKTTDHP